MLLKQIFDEVNKLYNIYSRVWRSSNSKSYPVFLNLLNILPNIHNAQNILEENYYLTNENLQLLLKYPQESNLVAHSLCRFTGE